MAMTKAFSDFVSAMRAIVAPFADFTNEQLAAAARAKRGHGIPIHATTAINEREFTVSDEVIDRLDVAGGLDFPLPPEMARLVLDLRRCLLTFDESRS